MPTMRELLARNTEKAFFQNLDTGQEEAFLINPARLRENYAARYKRHTPYGLSHQPLQFEGNDNANIPMTLLFDNLTAQKRLGEKAPSNDQIIDGLDTNPSNEVERWRRFLMSLVYPRNAVKIRAASPPPVLFYWPGMITMQVRIMSVSFRHSMFQTGRPLPRVMSADVVIEEEPLERIYSQDVLEYGTLRPWAGSIGLRTRRGRIR